MHAITALATVEEAAMAQDLERAINEIWVKARRDDPEPTVARFGELLGRYPEARETLFAYASALDYAGHEDEAAVAYERAIAAGLAGESLRKGLLQYGSTLRNLGRFKEAIAALRKADDLFPGHDSVKVFLALALTSAGRSVEAVSELIVLALDRIGGDDLRSYDWALRHYAAVLPDQVKPAERTLSADA